jgi:hypothetical protein
VQPTVLQPSETVRRFGIHATADIRQRTSSKAGRESGLLIVIVAGVIAAVVISPWLRPDMLSDDQGSNSARIPVAFALVLASHSSVPPS